nr:putative ribonuclease H-like domain-containing protein [Tanacetum cinerariifolium]
MSSVNQPLQILHMDLFGPTSVRSINHKTYFLVITDGFSRFSWVYFLKSKDETTPILKDFIRQAKNQFNHKVKTIRSDNRTEFKNKELIEFRELKGIKREYSNARTPQQNRVADRLNKTLIEAARTMLADLFLPTTFWAEAVNTACYVLNKVLVTKPQNKTPYELLTGKQPIISYLRPFRCHVTILNTIYQLGKFDGKSDSGFLVGYSLNSKAFRVYNLETKRVEENLHVNFLENKPNVTGKGHAWMFDLDYLTNSMNYEPVSIENQANKYVGPKEANNSTCTQANDYQGDKIEKNNGLKTCEKLVSQVEHVFLEELDKLKRQEKEANDASESLRKEASHDIQNTSTSSITKLIVLVHHLVLLVLQEHSMMVNFQILILLSVVTDFNNLGTTVSVSPTPTTRIHTIHPKTQILGDPNLAVQTRSKVNKNFEAHALISQALEDESWVDAMQEELLEFQIKKGHRQEEGIDYYEVFAHVARIKAIRIFLAFASYIGFIVYQMDVKSVFLYGTIDEEVLQIKKKEDGIFISQDKYVAEILKKFDFLSVKTTNTPIETQKPLVKDEEAAVMDVNLYRYLKGQPKLGLLYPKVSSFDLKAYLDSDYAGANLNRKSTTRGCQFLSRRLISWQCKKQTIVATSTTEAEYVAAAHYCGQVLWIQNQLLDYGFNFMNIKIYIDNESTICIVKNLVFHSKTKHIKIRHHFIRDAYEKKLIQELKIHTDDNVVDLLTKAFDVSSKELASPKQTALGKDISNSLMAVYTYYCQLKVNAASPKLTTARVSAAETKPTKSEGFEQIIDFLNRSSVSYAFTTSPTIRTSCIKQFWTTAKVKNINDEVRIQALIDEKRVNIKESTIRHTLKLDDAEVKSIPTKPSTSKPHKKHKPKKQQPQAAKVPSHEPSPKHRLPSPTNDPLPGERIEKLEGRVDKLEEENRILKELYNVYSKVDTATLVVKKENSFKWEMIIADIDEDFSLYAQLHTFKTLSNLNPHLIYSLFIKPHHHIIDFLNRSSVSYAFTTSPTIRTSCIKQFWTTAKVKNINDEVRIQPLIDEKRVNIKESTILHTLKLDDAEGTSCLANAEIFDVPKQPLGMNLAALWHQQSFVLLQIRSLTSQAANEVGLIQDDVQSKSIPTKPSTSKPHKKHKPKKQQPQAAKVPSHEPSPKYRLPSPTNDPLPGGKDSMKLKELMDLCTHLSNKVQELESEVIDIKSSYKERIEKLKGRVDKLEEENRILKELYNVYSKVYTATPVVKKENSFKQEMIIADIDEDFEINLEEAQAKLYRMDLKHQENVLSMQDANDEEPVEVENIPRRRRGVVIQDPEETTSTAVMHSKVQSKDKGKVKGSERLNDAVMKYQALKRKPFTEAKERKNMIIYLKNMVGFKMNYFKGMTYSKIRPVFEKHFNYNQAFLEEVNEDVTLPEKEVEVEAHKRESESLENEITKKQKMDEEVEELRIHFQIVSNDDDDVYTEATPLALKIPIVDYKIHFERNKPYFKIIRIDDSEIVKAKVERKSIALKAKKESSDEECLTFRSKDDEYAMAIREFKKFFKRKGRFVRQPQNDKNTFQRSRDDKNGKSDRKFFRCGDPNHLLENVQNHRKIRIKERLSEVLGAIAVKKMIAIAQALSEILEMDDMYARYGVRTWKFVAIVVVCGGSMVVKW